MPGKVRIFIKATAANKIIVQESGHKIMTEAEVVQETAHKVMT